MGELGTCRQDGLGHGIRDVQVLDLQSEIPPCRCEVGSYPVLQGLMAEPHHEVGTGIVFREANGLKENAQQLQTDALTSPSAKRPSCSMESTHTPCLRGELREQILNGLRQPYQSLCPRAVGELEIDPQMVQHLD